MLREEHELVVLSLEEAVLHDEIVEGFFKSLVFLDKFEVVSFGFVGFLLCDEFILLEDGVGF